MRIRNYTPFTPLLFEFRDVSRQPYHVLILKGTFRIPEDGSLRLVPDQRPIRLADAYHGQPGESSLRWESDVVPHKPRTDVVLHATAHAPGGRAIASWPVWVSVGGDLCREFRVCGPRRWEYRSRAWRLTDPEPCAEVPLRYEFAFGGTARRGDEVRICEENPVGVGFVVPEWADTRQTYPAPQIEDPDDPVREFGRAYAPQGVGPLAKAWLPRRQLCGTPDAAWLRTRWPDLPLDFDYAYFNGAHPRLTCPGYLRGDEAVVLDGIHPDGPVALGLPGYEVGVLVDYKNGQMGVGRADLDTVAIDVPAGRVELVWRRSFPVASPIRTVVPVARVTEALAHG